ncbi:hypothetical protein [Sulfitobacter sp.]|uniref:hypothetical protein n=1 Tax=Sulfitobacter sp. TaxID=1903071 RepID=UPI003F6BA7CA
MTTITAGLAGIGPILLMRRAFLALGSLRQGLCCWALGSWKKPKTHSLLATFAIAAVLLAVISYHTMDAALPTICGTGQGQDRFGSRLDAHLGL